MLDIVNFKEFVAEATNLTPAELKKDASGGPNVGVSRLEIFTNMVKKQEPLTLMKGGTVIAANTEEVLASIEQFKKDSKTFKFVGLDGKTYSTSDIKKSAEFGGGAGAGGGTAQTAVGESAQCLWMAAMLGEGHDKPVDYFTDEILSKYFKRISVGKTSLKDILNIDEGWKTSAYLTAQYAIRENIIDRDMTFHRDDKLMKAIYSAKNVAFKNNDFKPLPDDKWNPGDIWAAERGFNVDSLDTSTLESYNDDILDAYLQKTCVGISLKKVKKACTGVEKNVERPPETSDYKFSEGHIKALVRGEWYTTKANYITFAGGQVDLRANTAFGSHKAEIKGKGARGGGVSWGFMQDASKRIYGKSKMLPKNTQMKKEAKAILKGDRKAIAKFTKMLNLFDKTISEDDVLNQIVGKKGADVWAHGKLGGLYILELIHKGGKKADQFVTQMVNYAGSSTSDSSAYIKLMEK
jgi:hypothetical protein